MNGSKELNAEEILRRMEQMAEEMDRNERTISSLQADKEELLAEVGQQKRQISQLIDYAEALNRENSEEGVKKLNETVSKLRQTIEEKQGELERQRKQLEEKEEEMWKLKRSTVIAEAERDKADMAKEQAETMQKIAELRLERKPLTVEKTVYERRDDCITCSAKLIDRKMQELQNKERRDFERWSRSIHLLLLLIGGYAAFVTAGILRSSCLKSDFSAAAGMIFGLFPAGWFLWIKVLLLIVTGILLCILAIILHCSVIWDWKDDVVYAWMVSVMIAFSDEIRTLLHWNLMWVMLASFGVYIAIKLLLLIMKEW